jgi:hypothetical protein
MYNSAPRKTHFGGETAKKDLTHKNSVRQKVHPHTQRDKKSAPATASAHTIKSSLERAAQREI